MVTLIVHSSIRLLQLRVYANFELQPQLLPGVLRLPRADVFNQTICSRGSASRIDKSWFVQSTNVTRYSLCALANQLWFHTNQLYKVH